jgi:hypothetical protein
MRQSSAVNRSIYAYGGSSQSSSAALQARLLEKKKEFEAVSALENASSLLLKQIESISADVDIMADAGQSKIACLTCCSFFMLMVSVSSRSGFATMA